jgi:hypothetical protein
MVDKQTWLGKLMGIQPPEPEPEATVIPLETATVDALPAVAPVTDPDIIGREITRFTDAIAQEDDPARQADHQAWLTYWQAQQTAAQSHPGVN